MKFYEHRMEKIKAVFNWSGGKDSAHALWRARQSELYDIVALLTTINRDSQRSSMHGIPLPLLQAQADSIGIPLHIVNLTPQGNLENYGKVIISCDNFSAMIVFMSSSFLLILWILFWIQWRTRDYIFMPLLFFFFGFSCCCCWRSSFGAV